MSEPEFPEDPDDSNRLERRDHEDWDKPFAVTHYRQRKQYKLDREKAGQIYKSYNNPFV